MAVISLAVPSITVNLLGVRELASTQPTEGQSCGGMGQSVLSKPYAHIPYLQRKIHSIYSRQGWVSLKCMPLTRAWLRRTK